MCDIEGDEHCYRREVAIEVELSEFHHRFLAITAVTATFRDGQIIARSMGTDCVHKQKPNVISRIRRLTKPIRVCDVDQVHQGDVRLIEPTVIWDIHAGVPKWLTG